MKTSDTVSCHLARDLFIPYLAAEVSPETRTWLESHLAGCASCRSELGGLSGDGEPPRTPVPTASPDTGRRVIGRVRLWVLGLTGVVVFCLALVAAILLWMIPTMRTVSNMPADHAVPAAEVSPEQAVRQDLTALGLTFDRIWETPDGAIAQYNDAAGHSVQIEAHRLPAEAEAKAAYRGWLGSFPTHLMSVQFDLPGASAIKFRANGSYHYGWRTGNWFIAFSVPSSTPGAAQLRDQIRDRLIAAYQKTQR